MVILIFLYHHYHNTNDNHHRTHNDQPKLDYVERRAKLEQDHKDLQHCINVLENLEIQQ